MCLNLVTANSIDSVHIYQYTKNDVGTGLLACSIINDDDDDGE